MVGQYQAMRKTVTLPLVLLVVAACSTFASQRVVQYNATIEEAYKQVTIYLDAGKLSADDGAAVIAALDVASKQVDRYWDASKTGAPRSVKTAILQGITDALAEAEKILLAKGAK